jgi:hypothetical protein
VRLSQRAGRAAAYPRELIAARLARERIAVTSLLTKESSWAPGFATGHRLVYGGLHGLVFRFGGGWDLGPAGRSHASAGPLS